MRRSSSQPAAPSGRAGGSRPRPRPRTAGRRSPRRRSPCRGRPAGSAARRRPARPGPARRRRPRRARTASSRAPASSSWPIETQVSVASTSAPSAAAAASAVQRTEPPVSAAIRARPVEDGRGRAGSPPARRSARACRRWRRRAGRSAPCCWRRRRGRPACSPASAPVALATVCRSARIWHGWNSSVSALTTGHPADRGHRLDPVLAEGAPHDRGDLPVEHPRGVLDRLAAAELAAAARR